MKMNPTAALRFDAINKTGSFNDLFIPPAGLLPFANVKVNIKLAT